jgi:dolichol-phosphate mannosyltransferase
VPHDAPQHAPNPLVPTLAMRERLRDDYRRHRDPIAGGRMLWRAQSLRQLVHLLPGQTILELGSGDGTFTAQLAALTRGENPITAVTFLNAAPTGAAPPGVESLLARDLPGDL